MDEPQNPNKRANQVRKAQKLVAVLTSFKLSEDRAIEAQVAEQMTCQQWDDIAWLAGVPSPSSETIAIAVTMMKGRAECDQKFHRLTHDNQRSL